MIGSLKGTIIEKTKNALTIDVNGVGYRVFVVPTFAHDVQLEETVTLLIHTNVREDAIVLYGFVQREERELFEQVIAVSGVGPKTGLAVLSLATPRDIVHAIEAGDASLLTKVSGIGRKTAERIIVELREKVSTSASLEEQGASGDGEVIDALIGLGYSVREAREALREVKGKGRDAGEKIKEALKNLSP